jgi:hypothetical protein
MGTFQIVLVLFGRKEKKRKKKDAFMKNNGSSLLIFLSWRQSYKISNVLRRQHKYLISSWFYIAMYQCNANGRKKL